MYWYLAHRLCSVNTDIRVSWRILWPGKAQAHQGKVDCGWKYPAGRTQRRIPYNLAQKAAHEELRLREQGVLETVPNNQPTTWCTNPVIAPKPYNPEAIRFCSDMRVPNTAILRPVKEALTVEDIKFKLNGATVSSFLDMNDGYHQLELDESSRHMNTFYGTECKMRYTRMNYGIISTQDIFDKAMDDTRHPRWFHSLW